MIRSESIARAVLVLILTYMVAIGATFNGILIPEFKPLTLAITTLLVVVWLAIHYRRRWVWHRTPLDGIFLLWGLAFGVSLLANLEVWRRIVMGLWYVAVYIGVWYALQDILANRGLKRELLVESFLISGLIVLIFGYMQVLNWYSARWPLISAGLIPFELPRPVSTIGNTNAFATFLVVLIPLAAGQWILVNRKLARVVLSVYILLAAFLLFLTFSRGGWLALAAGLATGVVLLMAHNRLLSLRRLREWWSAQAATRKMTIMVVLVLILAGGIITISLVIDSLNEPGRSLGRRTILYQPAIQMFGEKPLTGYGLFTFGRGYMRLESLPPNQPHSHAHNAVLHIAAELGLFGLVALFATLGILIWTIRRSWQETSDRQKPLLMGATAAVAGFAVHHLTDTTAMMPAIALTGLFALTLALAPLKPVPFSARWRSLATPAGAVLMWAMLMLTGFWSSGVYSQYLQILRDAVKNNAYARAAQQLQPVIDADPSLALYHFEQAFLYGLAASEGDLGAARSGIDAYDKFLALEPQNAIAWTNTAALYWQVGEQGHAINAMQQAMTFAPDSWQIAFNLAMYAEESGDITTARQAYERALQLSPCSIQHPVWEETLLRQDIARSRSVTCLPDGLVNSGSYVLKAVTALEMGNRDEAVQYLTQARRVSAGTTLDLAWLHLGAARLARFDRDDIAAGRELQAGRDLLEPSVFDEDYIFGLNVPHAQFLRTAIPRQFLPQVFYPTADPLLVRLLSED